MGKFNLFSYLRWKNDKTINIANSSYKKYYDLNSHLFSQYIWLQKYNSTEDAFSVIKSVMILESLNNKIKIEADCQLYNDVDLSKNSTYEVIHNRLPFFVHEGIRIYVPFFKELYCEHYDRKINSLSHAPYITLREDFEAQTINPFDYYNIELFDSNFNKLIKVSTYEKLVAFYDVELETIFIVDDQGCLEQDIPLFDSYLIEKDKDNLFERLKQLLSFYFDNNREGFIDSLFNFKFISRKSYDFILKSYNNNKGR